MKMAVAQLTVKEDLCRRILDLPIETAEHLSRYLDDLEGHEPNEETIAALRESSDMRNLIGPFHNMEDFKASLLADDDA
jgi:hypothetical protein